MTFRFESYDETLITRKDGSQGKRGFSIIPLTAKWSEMSIAEKVGLIQKTDRISSPDVADLETSAVRDKMDAFASLYGFKGNAQVGKNGFVYCNRRPDSRVEFDSILEDADNEEILAQLGFGNR